MTRRFIKPLALVTVALSTIALTACAKETDDSNGKYKSTKELSAALLSITDMPSGWEESQRQMFDTRSPENPSIDPSVWCKQAESTAAPLVKRAGDAGADVEMSKPRGGGTGATMMRLQAWSNADAQEYFTTVRQAVSDCDGVTTTDENGAVSTTNLITNKNVGDESVSFSQQLTPPIGTQGEKFGSIGRTTIARFGTVIMVLQIGDAAPEGTLGIMDETQWWNLVNMAANKIKKM